MSLAPIDKGGWISSTWRGPCRSAAVCFRRADLDKVFSGLEQVDKEHESEQG